jgi:TonB-dependent receptor
VNVRYEVIPDLVLRGAVTTATGRPNYEDMVPTTLVDTTNVTIGNPALAPLTSVNFDAGIEYYLGKVGVISASVFQKDIKDPIYRQTTILSPTILSPVTFGGTTFTGGTVNVTQAQNATEGQIRGLELNLQGKASFLPYPLDGFGVAANLALIDSEATALGRTLPFFLQSDRVSTVQVFYELDGFEARVAYTMRSKYLDEVGTTAATDIYVADFGQLDARIAYSFSDNLTAYVEGNNLNDEPWRRFVGTENQLVENERYGWAGKVGVEVKY